MFLRQISDKYPEIKSLSTNIQILVYLDIKICGADIVPAPGTCTCSKIAKYLSMSEYPVGESNHLLQNRGISDIRIRYFISERCFKSTKYPKISCKISARALDANVPKFRVFGVEYLTRWRGMAYNHPWYVLVPQNAPDFRRDRFINNNSLSTC
jgi:hypothetical protein